MGEKEQSGREIERMDQPLQILPAAGSMMSLEQTIAQAEKFIEIQDRVRKLALRLTSVADWTDEGGRPYLAWSGSSKVSMALGVSYKFDTMLPEVLTDEHGEFLEYTCTGTVMWNGRSVPEVGTGSSRDSFFGVRKKENKETGEREKYYLPLSEVDRTDVKKKAVTNFLNRGLKSLVGLSFEWEEIAAATNNRITRELVVSAGGGVSFQKGKQGGTSQKSTTAEGANKRDRLARLCLEMANNDSVAAGKLLAQYSQFTGSNNQVIAGKTTVAELSDGRVMRTLETVEKEYAVWSKAQPAQTQTPQGKQV